uniref:Putative ovule protein n=1 Tax=Solanum chacoense TaxID=4108 RepID=A0A0V0H315_SOLCH
MDGEELKEGLSNLSDTELTGKIARLKKSLSSNIGVRLPDGGEKLRANIKLHEDELEWRKRVGSDQAESKPANAFQEELYALNPCDRKRILNNQFSQRKRHKRELLSQEAPYKSPVDKGEQVLNVDLKGWDSSTRSKENIASCFLDKKLDNVFRCPRVEISTFSLTYGVLNMAWLLFSSFTLLTCCRVTCTRV